MQAKCIKLGDNSLITIGKIYAVDEVDGSQIWITNDAGVLLPYRASLFEVVALKQAVVTHSPLFPHDSASRKAIPIVSGLLDYFPSALAEVAKVSKAGNDKHNPGQPLHHARGKSTDHPDSAVRHLMEFRADPNAIDPDTGCSVLASALWRVAAMLQEHLESKGAPMAPGARKAAP